MTEKIIVGILVASLVTTGGFFLQTLRLEYKLFKMKQLVAQLQKENLRLQTEIVAAKIEIARHLTEKAAKSQAGVW